MLEKNEITELQHIKFGADGLIPVIAQDYESGEVLLLAYMDEKAAKETFSTGYAHYCCPESRLMTTFGADEGNTQKVMAAFVDNDGGKLLIKVQQNGKANLDKDAFTCFPTQITGRYNDIGGEMFGRLQRKLADFKENPEEGSYTSFLFLRGTDRIAKKVGEEAVELVIAAKNEEKTAVIGEAADLLYHMMMLLNVKDVKISEVCAELCKRNR